MNVWDKVTGNDMTKEWKRFEDRAKQLPKDYQDAWEKMKQNFWEYSNFSGRNLMPILESAIEMLEELSIEGLSVQEALGEDIKAVCAELAGEESSNSFREKWRNQLNSRISRKIGKEE